MSRRPRIDAPGASHHIMSRGIDGTDIFRDDDDRRFFVELLVAGLSATRCRCYAWALMPNHYHLVVRASEQPLETLMRPLNSQYAVRFNSRNQRRGYLFQERFRSIPTQDQYYLEELIRYVHLNPVRAGIVKSLEELDSYPWTGHAALVGNLRAPWQNTRDVLRGFGTDRQSALRAYRVFMKRGLWAESDTDAVDQARDCNASTISARQLRSWVIGDSDFVLKALKAHEGRLPVPAPGGAYRSIAEIAARVATEFGVPVERLKRRARKAPLSSARQATAFVSYHVHGHRLADIARFLHVSRPAVSMMLERGQELAQSRGMVPVPSSHG